MRNYDYVPDCPHYEHPDVCGEDMTPDEEEFLTDVYDHCRFCGAEGDLFYGLCNKCNEESK